MTTTVHIKSTCIHCGTINQITAAYLTDRVAVCCSHCAEPLADWGVLRGADRPAAKTAIMASRPSTISGPQAA